VDLLVKKDGMFGKQASQTERFGRESESGRFVERTAANNLARAGINRKQRDAEIATLSQYQRVQFLHEVAGI